MHPTAQAQRLSALIDSLLGHLARYGQRRGVAGPLLVLIWGHLRAIERQAVGLLARFAAGTLRRYPLRRPPRQSGEPRRSPQRGPLPTAPLWLVALVQETAWCAPALQTLLAEPGMAAALAQVPQLRRAVRPLCRMLGVPLPPTLPPLAPPPADPPPAPYEAAKLPATGRPRYGGPRQGPQPEIAAPSGPHPPARPGKPASPRRDRHGPRTPLLFRYRSENARAAIASTRRACFRCGISTILPSMPTVPMPGLPAKAATMRLACATSSASGVKASLMAGT